MSDKADLKRSSCKSCGADVYWLKQIDGKDVIVDTDPVKVFVEVASEGPQRVYSLRIGYQSHFSSCPDAAQWRKPK